jgi:L-iditol 2-dehydrogenase
MKTALFTGLHQIQIDDRPAPQAPGLNEVLVQIDRLGVCGSDVHYFTRGGIGDQALDYPATLGHECVGTIVATGPVVEGLAPGDRVAIDPAISCGRCDQCRAGRLNTCRNLLFMGCPGEASGAATELALMPAVNCLKLPEGVSLEAGVLAEPLSIGLHAVRLGEVHPAARVAVLGTGPIGLSVILTAKLTAPCTIYATDLLTERLTAASRCGADWTGSPRHIDVVAGIAQEAPWGLDIVFECSGEPECIDQAQALLTPGGTLVLVGIPHEPRVPIDMHTMRRKELTLKNVRRQKGCLAPVLRLIAQGMNLDPLLTHQFPLEEIQQAFELVAGYRDGVIKAIVDVSGKP